MCMSPFFHFRDWKHFEKNLLLFIAKPCWLRTLHNKSFVVLDKSLLSIQTYHNKKAVTHTLG